MSNVARDALDKTSAAVKRIIISFSIAHHPGFAELFVKPRRSRFVTLFDGA
jgi:hypothetical protein